MITKQKKLAAKCAAEFKAFRVHLPWNSRSQMIEMACEIASRIEILNVVRDKDFDDETVDFLLGQENTMDCLYSCYLELDNLSVTETIGEMIEGMLDKD